MNTTSGRRALPVIAVVLGTAVMGSNPVVAQKGIFKSAVELVPLTVTVTDPAGRYVPNLTAADFAIFEEGQPQVVSHFASSHVPVDLGFLLDTSSSMHQRLPLAQRAARGLLKQLRPGDRGAVAGIASSVLLHQPMTPELTRVDEALRSTHAKGNTALYDALYVVLRQYQQERAVSADLRRQVIVLLSDGIDTSSHVTFEDVLDLVRRLEVTIYVVSLAQDPALAGASTGDRMAFESAYALNTLARESGGRLFTPRAARELPAIYDAIGQELSHQYVIGYVPAAGKGDGTFRHVSVGVLEPRAGLARTRAGYFADRVGVGGNQSSFRGPIVP
jgi:Ca-activated chloride channel family protein